MKKRTEGLYREWSRLDQLRKPGKKILARKRRVGEAIIRARALEDREIAALEKTLKRLT